MASKTSQKSNTSITKQEVIDECCRPEFIYGGPFIKNDIKIEPFLNTSTPINVQLQGTFKKSFAYYSLKERLPIILTKVIDYCSREGDKIKSKITGDKVDVNFFIQYVAKLKNDLVTNKKYDHFTVDTAEAKKWNLWIDAQEQQRYFNNTWVFTECYVYRRLREGCELGGLGKFDPFDAQKDKSFNDSLEIMCIVAEKLVTMLPESEKTQRKADFITLLKLCLWANKCDLSLSAGSEVNLAGQKGEINKAAAPFDPFQMITDFKDKLLVDDTGKIADAVMNKAEAIAKLIAGNQQLKVQCSCHRLATLAGLPLCKEKAPPSATDSKETEGKRPASPPPPPPPPPSGAEGEEPPKIPCPAKMTIPQSVMFDIICDNAGYELFADLCLAHFLISQKIVEKIRFHVKNMPWFVSDVTVRDFNFVIDSCSKATFSRTVQPELSPATAEGEAPAPAEPRHITSDHLRTIGAQWKEYLSNGTFELMAEDYWTYPHVYKDMKTRDYNLYRKLQYACALLFKGDLNYRKLLGEKNWNPYIGFEPALQGFIPAPVIAVRTVKADLICGLPKGKFDQLMKIDEKWMEKGDYGVIQFCGKAEPLKASLVPCMDYGNTCFGEICPVHTDL